MLDDFFEGLEAAIVHIGRGVFYVAQGGRLELAAVEAFPGERGQPSVWRVEVQSVVVELVVGEKRCDMAVEAVARLGVKEEEAPFLFRGKYRLTGQPAVVFAVRRNEGALKLGDGLDDELPVDGRVAKGAGEERGIFGVPLQFGHHAVPILAHFYGPLHGFEGLVFEAGRASVPEKGRAPEHVKKRHGVAAGDTADALAKGLRIGEGVGGQVARGAGYGAIDGEDGVGKEPLAKGDALEG